MNKNEALEEIKEIRSMMERSSRFTTINGWGVAAIGTIALAAAWVANELFNKETGKQLHTLFGDTSMLWTHKTQVAVYGSLTLVVLCASIVIASSVIMARKHGIEFSFNKTMQRLLLNFSVPLLAGGLLCLSLVLQGHYGLTSSIMLIFYGLALINCHHFTHPSIGLLGYLELALGIIDSFTAIYALLFWAIGFGVLHLMYGIYLIARNTNR